MKKVLVMGVATVSLGLAGYLFLMPESAEMQAGNSDQSSQVTESRTAHAIDGQEEHVADSYKKTAPESDVDVASSQALSDEETTTGLTQAEFEKLTEFANKSRGQLEDLIHQFDANLSDPSARAELKQQMDSKLEEYNESILPLALSQMKERAQ